MKIKNVFVFASLFLCLILRLNTEAFAGDLGFGIGIRSGISYLEGDFRSPGISPMVAGYLRIIPNPFFAISGDLGFSQLKADDFPAFKSTIVPFEVSGIFSFLPFQKINPYIMIGGGGVYWKATNAGITLEDNIDSFLKTGGGLEFRVADAFSLDLSSTYRFSFTDALDQLRQGSENDQVLDLQLGLTYFFSGTKDDKDKDSVPDELDLMPEIAEDRDGYMDHDGIPEKNPSSLNALEHGTGSPADHTAPIVIHNVIRRAESGHKIPVKAHVYSNVPLRVVAVIYRPIGAPNWQVVRMTDLGGSLYEGIIPGYNVSRSGLEYSVVAVDETLTGIGYSGLPSLPIRVQVSPSGTPWRILGGIIGASTISTASYLIIRKQ